MNALSSAARRLRRSIACVDLGPDEINSLRSLLGLLAPYLKHAWEVGPVDRADLVLVKRDSDDAPSPVPEGVTIIGCARRPRQHASPTIHRPLRASEVLAVLNEFEEDADHQAGVPTPPPAPSAQAWRLAYWPLDFETFPSTWWRVLAALSGQARTRDELVRCTGLARGEISQCLQRLREVSALIEADKPSPPRATQASKWRHIIAGIGRKLGFSN